jgi:tripartite ATP-independent transporter DctM subunit
VSAELLAPCMFLVCFGLIFTGYPVAFSLGGSALLFFLFGLLMSGAGVEGVFILESDLLMFPSRVFGVMSNQVLLAVPFFIFMGVMLEKSRLAEDLLITIGQLFGQVRGGLALAVVFVGALLAAATGVVGASVVAMGLISMPVMLRYGYSPRLTSGVITASGTLGQIIPPSVVLIVLADQMDVSVGDLFLAAVVPGFMLTGMFALYILYVAKVRPEEAPALPPEARAGSTGELLKRVALVLLPPLLLIIVVLGSIFAGIATPTEAGALGALGAMILAGINKRLNREALDGVMSQTTRLSSMVMFLLIGSTAFTLVFRLYDGDIWIQGLLTALPGGKWGLLIMANLVIFILGFFIDFFEIAFIILPLIVPAAEVLQIDMIWFAILIAMNLQTSFLTPPFGFALFYLRGVAPESVKTSDIYRGAVPFIGVQLLALGLVAFFPGMVHAFLKAEPSAPAGSGSTLALPTPVAKLELSLPSWPDGQTIPARHALCVAGELPLSTSPGENRSPEIRWGSPPEGTRSILVLLTDLDAPEWAEDINQSGVQIGETDPRVGELLWAHWTSMGTGSLAEGAGGTTYQGPCPPWNDALEHNYLFSVYALDVESLELGLDLESTKAAIEGHVLALGTWLGR